MKNFHSHYSMLQKKGFTLLETLVAISILLIGLTAAFSAAQSGLSSTIAVKDRITAIFLAQEAMEAVRNLKDSNLLAQNASGSIDSPPFLGNIKDINGTLLSYANGLDYNFVAPQQGGQPVFISCGIEGNCPVLNIDGGFYTHQTSATSKATYFKRDIVIEEISYTGLLFQKEARVKVTIKWPCSSQTCPSPKHTYMVQDDILNWFAP